MKIEVRTITPEAAAALLENNPQNRSIRPAHVAALARDMKRGDFQLNGDAIRLNGDGSLIDGQHRLSACVAAGVPFTTIVVSGLPSDVRNTIDGGARRSFADRLTMVGVPNATTVNVAISRCHQIATGVYTGIRLSDSERRRILEAHPDLGDSAMRAKPVVGIGGMIGAIHYIATYTGKAERADAFLRVWIDGIPDYEGDPVHQFRDRYLKARGSLKGIPPFFALRMAVNTWLHFSERKPIKIVRPSDAPMMDGWNLKTLGLAE